VGVTSVTVVAVADPLIVNGKGEEDGYRIIINRGDEEGDADPFCGRGHGVIITSGVEVGVSTAVGVEEG
jgi:hypothetical protein